MPDTHDYPLAEVLGSGDLIHQARPAALFGSRIETRCGMEGNRTGRDGGAWCPECVALAQAEVDANDKSSTFRNDLRTQLVTAGTEAAEQWLAVRANRKMSDVNRKRLAGHVVNALWTEIERAAVEMAPYFGDEQLAAATARAEKAERQFNLVRSLNRLAKANAVELHAQLDAARARIAELGEPEVERRIIGVSGRVYTPTEFDLPHRADWVPGVRLEERQVYPTPWRVAPDAAQDGLSEPVERSETSGGAFHGNTSATASAGLSEPEPPRDTSAWCWAPNPNGPLRCGRLRDHEPPHRRGERTWTDDDTTGADR